MGNVIFPCGCVFKTKDDTTEDFVVVDVLQPFPKIVLDITDIDKVCKNTWDLISAGNTIGLFQLESNLGKHWSKQIVPQSISELSAVIALIRPGTLEAMLNGKSMTQHYTDRKNGSEAVEYINDITKSVMGETYNVMAFQEQAILLASKLAGFSLEEADILRRGIGHKDGKIISDMEKKFLDGCSKTAIITQEQAEEIFTGIKASQRYLFNKSHSIAYSIDSYWTAFCKAHFPIQFYCAYLYGANWKQKPLDEIKILVNDAKKSNIEILPPDIRAGEPHFYIHNQKIHFGFADIKGVGESAATKLSKVLEKHKDIDTWTWIDFLLKLTPKVSSTVCTALISTGACDFFNMSRTRMLYELELFYNLSDKELEWINSKYLEYRWTSFQQMLKDCCRVKKDGGGCHSAKRVELVQKLITSIIHPPHSLEDNPVVISQSEDKLLGIALTANKVENCVDASNATHTIKQCLDSLDIICVVAAEITQVKTTVTKKGKNPGESMGFIDFLDVTGAIDHAVCFPNRWIDYEGIIYEGNTVLVQLERNTKQEGFIVQKLWQI